MSISLTFFAGGEAVEKVAWRSCGRSILGGVQYQVLWGPEQPHLVGHILAYSMGVEIRWSLESLPTQAILGCPNPLYLKTYSLLVDFVGKGGMLSLFFFFLRMYLLEYNTPFEACYLNQQKKKKKKNIRLMGGGLSGNTTRYFCWKWLGTTACKK